MSPIEHVESDNACPISPVLFRLSRSYGLHLTVGAVGARRQPACTSGYSLGRGQLIVPCRCHALQPRVPVTCDDLSAYGPGAGAESGRWAVGYVGDE